MHNQHNWLAVFFLALLIGGVARADETDPDKCAEKVTQIDAAIEEARKEGSMRKVATLKDLRAEAQRCANRHKE